MSISSSLRTSVSTYASITPSNLTASVFKLEVSMITNEYQQDFKLDPGDYSVNPDEDQFSGNINDTLIETLIFNLLSNWIDLIHIIVQFVDY